MVKVGIIGSTGYAGNEQGCPDCMVWLEKLYR